MQGGRTILSEITKLFTSNWNKEEFPVGWKESIIVPLSKWRYKRAWNNYRGMSHLLITYKILSNISLSKLTPYAEEIIGDN